MHKHVIADISGCKTEKLFWNTSEDFRKRLKEIVSSVATILNESWHVFDNGAYTGVILLAESHFSMHTWPENGVVNLDLFTCGESDPEIAVQKIVHELSSTPNTLTIVNRCSQ